MEQRKTIIIIIEIIAVVLHLKGSPVETMGTVSVLTGTDVTLSCLFDKLSKLVKLSTLTVEWNMVDKHSEKHNVYTFLDESAQVNCKGCLVDKMGLLQSNASLQLRNVTLGDEGIYTCRIITPVVYTETIQLEVLARPSVSLPEKAVVTMGEEKTLLCDVTEFYPEKLEVTWQIQKGSLTVPAGRNSSSHVCTEMAILNPDGTYSIRSSITVHSSVVEATETHIFCQIKHTTYRELYSKGVVLTVQASREPGYNAVTLIAVTSVISLLMVLSVIGGTRLICTGPPCVSDIITPSVIYTKVPIELKCTIRGVRLRELKVKWDKVAANADLIQVPNNQSESDPLLVSEDLSDLAILQSESRHDHVSVLTVCLTVSDDQTTYRCVVKHRAKNITREITVNTKVAPEFLQISSMPQIPKVERLLVLCSRVEKFYPGDIRLEWSRNDGEQVCTVTNFGPFSDHEGLFSVWSEIQMVMAREDEMAVYSCRVYHSSFPEPGYKDSWYHINTQGTPPNVMFVNCEPSCPLLGEECTLNLCIKDFCPEDVSITWSKNGENLTSAFNTPPSLNINGLYTMWSFLKLTPSREDQGSQFSCQVVHSAQKEAEERTFTLTHLDMITTGLG